MTNAVAGCSNTSIGVPCCSIFPLFITTTRSATSNASSWSCVTKMLVTWNSLVELAEPRPQFAAHLGVERAERLVEEQHLGIGRQCADQRDALLLPAGELGGVAIRLLFQPHEAEQFHHAVADLLLGRLADAQPEGDVLEHGHVPEEGVVLEHEPDVAVAGRVPGDVVVLEQHGAGVGNLQPGDDAEQGGLARSRRAQERDELTGGALDGDVVERNERRRTAW